MVVETNDICESEFTFNNFESNASNESIIKNTQNESENNDTNYNLDIPEAIIRHSQLDEQFIAYDINSSCKNGDLINKFDTDNENSLELSVISSNKITDIHHETEKPKSLQDFEAQNSPEVFKVYKRRFWILAVYCYSSFMMLLIWGTFSPILDSAEYAYDWSDGYIALLEGWGSIFSLLTMIPFGYAVNKYGLRMGMILICSFEALATGLRCVTTNVTAFTYLASLSCMINGMTSCVVLSLPALISVVWFPINERATATAISTTSLQLGITGMYLSPLVVRAPENSTELSEEDIRSDMQLLMFIYFGMALLALACALIYFPKAPPSPPSASSQEERVNFLKSLKTMIKKYDVMTIVLIYTFSTSIPFCWLSVINLSMDCLGLPQDESMGIAIVASLLSILMTIVVGRLSDYFHGYMKVSITVLLLTSSGCFFWFLLISEQVVIASKAQIYIAIIFGIGLQYSSVPLMFELAVELAYPSPENAVGILFSAMMELSDVSFLLLMMIPSDCYVWLSYAMVASTCLTVIPLVFVKEVYHRSAVDKKNGEPVVTNGFPSLQNS